MTNKVHIVYFSVICLLLFTASNSFAQDKEIHFEHLTVEDGLPNNSVWIITQDYLGFMWFTTSSGLVKYDGVTKTLYDSSNSGLPDNMIHSITFEDSAYIWLGTLQGGVARFDRNDEWVVYNEDNSGLPGNEVLCVTIDSDGNKWIGTWFDGLGIFDGDNWVVYDTTNSPLPHHTVIDIAIDSIGNKWIATEGGGLAKFDGTNWEIFNTSNSGLKSDDLIFVKFDVNGNLWIGSTFGGLTVYNGKTWRVFDNTNSGLNDENALSIAFDSNGDAWIGTWMGGVSQFVEGVIVVPVHILVRNLPEKYLLSQNYPNPFNPSTGINYSIPKNSFVSVKVYDVLGNEVAVLVNKEKPAGNYSVEFNANNLSSGVYFYRIQAGSFIQTKKMLLIK